jgi:hypothetical protein
MFRSWRCHLTIERDEALSHAVAAMQVQKLCESLSLAATEGFCQANFTECGGGFLGVLMEQNHCLFVV